LVQKSQGKPGERLKHEPVTGQPTDLENLNGREGLEEMPHTSYQYIEVGISPTKVGDLSGGANTEELRQSTAGKQQTKRRERRVYRTMSKGQED